MPTVEFVMDDLVFDVDEGEKLVDAARRLGSSIPFGCTNGVCGTCITKIVSGGENLGSLDAARENNTLEMFGADDGNHRLACQCVVKGNVVLDNP